jgi:hypothetical protein
MCGGPRKSGAAHDSAFNPEGNSMKNLKSVAVAAMLSVLMATAVTAGHAIVHPGAAQAGVLSSVKGAAKKVGGAVKNTAKGIGAAAKAGASVGKQAGTGVGSTIKRAAVRVGHEAAKVPLVKDVRAVASSARKSVRR